MNIRLKIGLFALGLMTAGPGQAEELGRLFFTPVQRAQLETGNLQSAGSGSRNAVTINGIVQRHGGARTVWVNGVPKPAGASDERSPESLPLTLPGKSHPVRAKVGQKLLINPAASEDR